ncbi:MAG: NAD(P)/FAD-dependent oxidoreductase [Flavobacteriales bacterium]|nr:NAD(P)/FAD-dependent oxidoreductase [Flavobacteriales bacterium]
MYIPETKLPRVVIIGAGFAGLQVAKNINTKSYQIVLIDKNNYHTFQPLLYQVASTGLEPDSIAYPIRKILQNKKNAFYRLADVSKINIDSSTLSTNIGEIAYDILVIATGATNNFFGNDSLQKNSLPMKTLIDSLNLRSKILGNFELALNEKNPERKEALLNFVIVGAGPTGVELAGALAELRNNALPKDFPDLDLSGVKVTLIEAAPRVLSAMSEIASKKSEDYLKGLGVTVMKNTRVKEYENNIVSIEDGSSILADTLIWAAGVKGQFPAGITPENIVKNRILTDGYCKMKLSSNVYVLGDVAFMQSEEYPNGLPMLASVADQQGRYLGKSLNSLARLKTVKRFIYQDKGHMATVGKNKAVVDTKPLKFQGIFAWFVWMTIHLMLLVGFRNRAVVLVNWAWAYFKSNNSLRLIIRPFHSQKTH